MSFELIITAAILGVGLAMDAFSVSLANGLAEKNMRVGRMSLIAGTFAGFQFLMPMNGWVCVHLAASKLKWFEKMIPWIALILLLYIGGKMLIEGIKGDDDKAEPGSLAAGDLIVQGIATSIDALSVGFTIAAYEYVQACCSALIIGAVTFVICMAGLAIGKKMGTALSCKASILGGAILIAIGIEIFVKGMFF